MSIDKNIVLTKDSVEIPDKLKKYWCNRREYFFKFDDGIRIDLESLCTVKPERVADDIADRIGGAVVYDAFCGVGGSAIAFARAGKRVISTDISSERIELARHNAAIYGVSDLIEFRVADALEMLSEVQADAVYLDPSWGGIDYYKLPAFLFTNFEPSGDELIELALCSFPMIAITVPTNFDFNELKSVECEFRCVRGELNGRLLFYTIFFTKRN